MNWVGFSLFFCVGCANKNDTTDVTKIRNVSAIYLSFSKKTPKYGEFNVGEF